MIRRALVAAAVAAVALVALPTAPAQAKACSIDYFCVTTYFSDAAHTTVVGSREEDCGGLVYVWGTRSSYVDIYRSPC
ncbi:DUF6289 family protein [Nonomuraea sp. NEAU-A123]|uniref:DUF6289 family protein n=1 Tax=Nonomuraea sp. NEAU-A123 TaxID=2839649 RepID=UPI001BE4E0DF|nr:DUF6289 family protein [Nonomuraea sp. NEAU-A123]MBT2226213.1 hypothetical protein [Nonomuraea sp. NEAU-A123]